MLVGFSRKSSLGKIMGDPDAKTGTAARQRRSRSPCLRARRHDLLACTIEHVEALTAARAIVTQ